MIRIIIVATAAFLGGVTLFGWVSTSSCEGDVYAQIVPLGGLVSYADEKGRAVPVPYKLLLFRRLDCKKCVSSVMSDDEGNYVAYLSEGKYELIVQDCGDDKTKDCLAADQQRIQDIKLRKDEDGTIDIKLIKDVHEVKPPKNDLLPGKNQTNHN